MFTQAMPIRIGGTDLILGIDLIMDIMDGVIMDTTHIGIHLIIGIHPFLGMVATAIIALHGIIIDLTIMAIIITTAVTGIITMVTMEAEMFLIMRVDVGH